MPSLVEARRELTRDGIDRLAADLAGWVTHRIGRDASGQYRTQLASIRDTFLGALDRIRLTGGQLAEWPAGEVFEGCRAVDRQTGLVHRLWRWYAEKFDQRDDPRYARVLAAADEVVWAVHAQVYRAAGVDPVPPAPLPYLDAVEAPEAVLRAEPPARLRPDSFDDQLGQLLRRLPVPVVVLPDAARSHPWTLVLLGHEVGHHLQYDLRPRFELVASSGDIVAGAAGPGPDGERWRAWSAELFADLAGLVTMGPAALGALLPYELGGDEWLITDREGYPPPAVRISVTRAMARRLGLDCAGQLSGLQPGSWVAARPDDRAAEARARARADVAAATAVADALVAAVAADGATLAELADFDPMVFAAGGRVAARVEHLLDGGGPAEQSLATVRELASAGMLAWQRVSHAGTAQWMAGTEALAGTLVDRLSASREPGTRVAAPASAAATDRVLIERLGTVALA